MHVVVGIVVIWIVVAVATWTFLYHKYAGKSSEIVIPFWIIVLAIALWPITAIGALLFGIWTLIRDRRDIFD